MSQGAAESRQGFRCHALRSTRRCGIVRSCSRLTVECRSALLHEPEESDPLHTQRWDVSHPQARNPEAQQACQCTGVDPGLVATPSTNRPRTRECCNRSARSICRRMTNVEIKPRCLNEDIDRSNS